MIASSDYGGPDEHGAALRLTEAEIERRLPQYEGLVFCTAVLIEGQVELDLDDIRQRLRIKVWKALVAFDTVRQKVPLRNYVNVCVQNEKKDILKQKRAGWVYIEDELTLDDTLDEHNGFHGRYLSITEDEVYAAVLDDDLVLPSTLDRRELKVVALLYAGHRRSEIRDGLGISKAAMDALIASVKEKLADWRPSVAGREHGPTPPLPHGALAPASPEAAPSIEGRRRQRGEPHGARTRAPRIAA